MDSAAVLNVVVWVVATAATAVGTWFVSRRSSKSTFLAELIKENEWLRAKNKELDTANEELNKQARFLGQENLGLLRRIEKESRDE